MPWSDHAWPDSPTAGWWLACFLIACFVLALAGTWWARRYAIGKALLDQPGARRSHRVATPRGGGIAIAVTLLLAGIWLAAHSPGGMPMLAAFALGLAMVATVGWLDDHRPLSPWWRLAVHALASALFAIGTWWVTADPWLAAIAFVATVVLTNIWNFMDGIDGLATSQAVIVAAGLAWLATGAWSWLALALLAASLGFLPFNFPRASIFLGDVGSGVLGYALGALVTAAIMADAAAWPLAMLPLAAFLIDAGSTLLRRIVRGERWWTPHVQHAYQVRSRHRQAHVPITLEYAFWTLSGVVITIALDDASFTARIIMLMAWYVLTVALWWMIQRDDAREI